MLWTVVSGSAWLLVLAIFLVGILHTMVPDHWLPIALIARQRNWSRAQTARAALIAGTGHVVTTLLIGLAFWGVGAVVARTLGRSVDTVSSLALVGFGAWMVWSSWREMQEGSAATDNSRPHGAHHVHDHKRERSRTALLLILGSSPMIEGIPAFFAAAPYGIGVIFVMSFVFALGTIGSYVVLCVYSTAALQNTTLGSIERYGEVLSGLVILVAGVLFWIFPVM